MLIGEKLPKLNKRTIKKNLKIDKKPPKLDGEMSLKIDYLLVYKYLLFYRR